MYLLLCTITQYIHVKWLVKFFQLLHWRFGGKCVKALIARMEKAYETLDKYPETADEYVDYLLFLDDIQEQVS